MLLSFWGRIWPITPSLVTCKKKVLFEYMDELNDFFLYRTHHYLHCIYLLVKLHEAGI